MSQQVPTTKIPRRAAQMLPQELSPLTLKQGIILEKPRRHESQLPDRALARASAILHSPYASPMVTPSSSSSSRSKVNQQIMLQHFASLDIEMVYQESDEDDHATNEQRQDNYTKERADSMDMAHAFYSDH
jgi:hypothetical protein